MLPRKLSKVCTLTAPLVYFPSAQVKRFILNEIVVESKAKTSLLIFTLGTGKSAQSGRTKPMRYSPKSAKIRQSRFSLARERVV